MHLATKTVSGVTFILDKHNTSYTLIWGNRTHTYQAATDEHALRIFDRLVVQIVGK